VPGAAIANEDADGRPTDTAPESTGRADPADGDDRRAEELVPFVEVDGERDVLPAMLEEITRELSGRCRVVNPTGER